MANVTISLLYKELKQMKKELHELRQVLIPEEEVSKAERKELHSLFKEIEKGKGTEWRRARR